MDSVDKYQTRHFHRIEACVHVSVQGRRRFRHQHIGRRNSRCSQKSMQIAGLGRAVARIRAEVAPTGSCAIVPAGCRGFRQLSLNPYPAEARPRDAVFEHLPGIVANPWGTPLQDDCGLACSGAIDIEGAAADIHGAAGLRKPLPVPGALCPLVQ